MIFRMDKSILSNNKYKNFDQMLEKHHDFLKQPQLAGKENALQAAPPCKAARSKRKMIKKVAQGRGRPKKTSNIPVESEVNTYEAAGMAQATKGFADQDTPLEIICEEMKFIFIDFLNEINEEKGFVYSEQFRKKLAKCKKIKWSEVASWNHETQMNKIKQKYKQYDFEDDPNMTELLLKTSQIFAQQFTDELYRIIMEVYLVDGLIQQNQKKQDLLIRFAQDIFKNKDGKFYLFSLTFRADIKASKKMPFIKPQNPSPYINLVKKLDQLLQKMIDL